MIAEISGLEIGGIICAIIFGGLGLIMSAVALLKKQEVQLSPQPLTVEIVKALHEQFANKEEFEDHQKHNTERHGQLFNRIDKVERETRAEVDRRFTELGNERQATLEKLNDQFTFIRENISAINTELRIRNEQ